VGEFEELAAAYEGLEEPFADRGALESYRASMLARSAPQADFLVDRLAEDARVLEVGTGNGRLLVELGRRGAIGEGLGIDLARSRIAFAQDWADELGLTTLGFETGDVFERGHETESYSAVICITGAFAYFEPVDPGSGLRLARLLHDALEPGGLLVLELYPHPRERALLAATGGEARTWRELDPDDPWRFYLSHLRLDGDVLAHGKTFVHRTTGEVDSGRREQLQLYTPESIRSLLQAAGFRDLELFEGWTRGHYAGGDELVVTALK
jgi:SAM-dependent methyltransferase